MYSSYTNYLNDLAAALNGAAATTASGDQVPMSMAIQQWVELAIEAKERKRTCYFVGNGASATMASHMAVDCLKNAHLRALTFNEASVLTAVANDVSSLDIFSLPLFRFCVPGDILVAISSSGNSGNIIKAIEVARRGGLKVVTLTGMAPSNKARAQGDLNIYIPAQGYGIVESAHAAVLHCWLDHMLLLSREPKPAPPQKAIP